MLDNLAMYNKGSITELYLDMLMLEDLTRENAKPFGAVNKIDFLLTKYSKYDGCKTKGQVIGFSNYCLGKLLEFKGYFNLNEEIELMRWDFYHET